MLATVPWILLLAGCCAAQQQAGPRPPNIVLLYADDAGYADFGFQRRPASDLAKWTPHIDALARQGAVCTDAYMSGCVCSPSRAGLMTGRYQTRFGHEYNIPPGYMQGGLPLSETLMPMRLRTLGYATGLVGKWHLGYPPGYHPNKRGFDWFYGCLQGSRSYVPYRKPTPHRVIQENGQPTAEGGYVTDRFGDAAVRFITEHRDRPFFLFLSFTAPHGPLQAKAADLAELAHIDQQRRRQYAGLVKSLDDNVGKVLAALRQLDLERNTLVVFTNDNGGQTLTGADNTPLRGRKGTLFEGGIRVPMCIRWPGRIAPGTVISDPVIALDLLPTFVAAAGGAVDPKWRLDGVDLLPRLTGAVARLPARLLFWRKGDEIALRHGDHKFLIADRSTSYRPQVFDLSKDIGEQRDLSGQLAELRDRMAARARELDRAMVEAKWRSGGERRRNRRRDR